MYRLRIDHYIRSDHYGLGTPIDGAGLIHNLRNAIQDARNHNITVDNITDEEIDKLDRAISLKAVERFYKNIQTERTLDVFLGLIDKITRMGMYSDLERIIPGFEEKISELKVKIPFLEEANNAYNMARKTLTEESFDVLKRALQALDDEERTYRGIPKENML